MLIMGPVCSGEIHAKHPQFVRALHPGHVPGQPSPWAALDLVRLAARRIRPFPGAFHRRALHGSPGGLFSRGLVPLVQEA
jgi:hypothetical protein